MGVEHFKSDLGFRLPSYEQSLIYAEGRDQIIVWRHQSDVIIVTS